MSRASLHDHHNVEVRTVSELTNSSALIETDIHLFAPKSFDLPDHGKSELLKDFRSRVRLALPVEGELGQAAFEETLSRLIFQIKLLENADFQISLGGSQNHAVCEELLETSKDLAALVAESLKNKVSEHARRFALSQSLMATHRTASAGFLRLQEDIATTSSMMERIRSIRSESLSGQEILALLHEYLSNLYVQYLGTIRAEFTRLSPDDEGDLEKAASLTRLQLVTFLNSLQENEARERARFASGARLDETEIEREQRLLRFSHLKKFFHSKSFVNVSRKQAAAKFSESSATMGTAIAAGITAAIDFYGRPAMTTVALQGLLVLSFGVTIYVLRDRMKDKAKALFYKTAEQYLPDFEQTLMARQNKIGKVREWFRLLASKDIPFDIKAMRASASTSELERRLPEDVFHYRRSQELDTATIAETGRLSQSRTIYETTRINFERYLKHMDDAFKDLNDLDPSGRFSMTRSHRVYHFYLSVKTATIPLDSSMTGRLKLLQGSRRHKSVERVQSLMYRIVLDKQGIVRVEEVVGRAQTVAHGSALPPNHHPGQNPTTH